MASKAWGMTIEEVAAANGMTVEEFNERTGGFSVRVLRLYEFINGEGIADWELIDAHYNHTPDPKDWEPGGRNYSSMEQYGIPDYDGPSTRSFNTPEGYDWETDERGEE